MINLSEEKIAFYIYIARQRGMPEDEIERFKNHPMFDVFACTYGMKRYNQYERTKERCLEQLKNDPLPYFDFNDNDDNKQ